MKGFYFTFFLSACLGILFFNTKQALFLGLVILLLLWIYKKTSIQPIIIMGLCFLFFGLYRYPKSYHVSTTYRQYQVQVHVAKENYCLVKYQKNLFLLYNEQQTFYKNDYLQFDANLKKIENDSNLVGFEFKNYLKHQRVFYQFENINQLKLLNRKIPLNQKIISSLTSKLKKDSKTFISLLLFNDKQVDDITYNSLIQINALHLFVVSGFHFLFLNRLFIFLFSYLFKEKACYLSLIILFFYLFLLDFSISAMRAFICITLSLIDKKQKFTSLDYLSLSGFILLIIEPLNVFNLSFIMSYTLTFVLLLSKQVLKNRNSFQKNILLSFIAFLTMIPIQLSINYKINFISFFSNILLTYIVLFLFICSIISLSISFLSGNIFGFLYQFFFKTINSLAKNTPSLIFGAPSTFFIILFYIILFFVFLSIESNKLKIFITNFMFLILLLFFNYYKNNFKPYEQITFLDVYQGDCAILEAKWGKGVMLIDTGGIKNKDIATEKIIPYLEYKGIKQIDYVIISHDDFDHNGALLSLKQNFIVKKIIQNQPVSTIHMGSIHLSNINLFASQYEDSNNQSLVLYGKVANLNVLFTGDIDHFVEQQIIQSYPNLPVDLLKVAHHGSKNSSSESFLKHIQPKVAIISVGKNFYGHPHLDVINRLKKQQIKILQTNVHGGIYFSYRFHFYYLKTAK